MIFLFRKLIKKINLNEKTQKKKLLKFGKIINKKNTDKLYKMNKNLSK